MRITSLIVTLSLCSGCATVQNRTENLDHETRADNKQARQEKLDKADRDARVKDSALDIGALLIVNLLGL